MNKNSHTPPCRKENRSPKHNCIGSASRKQIPIAKPPRNRRDQVSASRSASRLVNQSDRGQSRSLRRECNPAGKQALSVGKKKLSLTNVEISTLVVQYESLRTAYQDLMANREVNSLSDDRLQTALEDNSRLKRQVEKGRNQNQFLVAQIQRIKKECVRIIDIEGFKIKKLQQTLQQKELMLQFLRSHSPTSSNTNQPQSNIFLQSTPIFRSTDFQHKVLPSNLSLLSLEQISAIQIVERNNFLQSSIHCDNKLTIQSQDSLVFSKDKSKSNNVLPQSKLESARQLRPSDSDSKILEPNCPTFDLKDLDENKFQLVFVEQKRKRLVLGLDDFTTEDDTMSHSTKKRINIPNHKQTSSQGVHCELVEKKRKKMDKIQIQIQLPKQKKCSGRSFIR